MLKGISKACWTNPTLAQHQSSVEPRQAPRRFNWSVLERMHPDTDFTEVLTSIQTLRDRLRELGGVSRALETLCAGFAAAGYIWRRSTSAGIHSAETGERYALSVGEHYYL